jgi:5-methylcytosine-specific restriction endonuclease McrA
MKKYRTLVLNSAFYPHNVCSWKDAICLIIEGKADLLETHPEVIHTVSTTFDIPSVIALKTYAKMNTTIRYSKKSVFVRDGFHCAYCGFKFHKKNLTIDHITPRSKNGETSWLNCISSCWACNHKKKDRTPQEANMPLLYHPKVPHFTYEYFENWDGECIEQWLKWLPKKKNNVEVIFNGEFKDIKFGRKRNK